MTTDHKADDAAFSDRLGSNKEYKIKPGIGFSGIAMRFYGAASPPTR